MRRARILLRLLVLAGSVILLMNTRNGGLAAYSPDCGTYNSTFTPCPDPCQEEYQTYTRQTDGPYKVPCGSNALHCYQAPDLGCTVATQQNTAQAPVKDSAACGCGDEGQWCTSPADCCPGLPFCQANNCASCLNGGQHCTLNTDCCSGTCDWTNHCLEGCKEVGAACGTCTECCSGYCEGTCCLGRMSPCDIFGDHCCRGLSLVCVGGVCDQL